MTLKDAADLSYNEKEKIHELISEIVEKSTDDQDGLKINRIEQSLNRFTIRQWNLLVTKAIQNVTSFVGSISKDKLSAADQGKIEKRIESALSKFADKISQRIHADIAHIYKTNRSRFQNLHKLSKRISKTEILKVKFDSVDQSIVKSLARLHLI